MRDPGGRTPLPSPHHAFTGATDGFPGDGRAERAGVQAQSRLRNGLPRPDAEAPGLRARLKSWSAPPPPAPRSPRKALAATVATDTDRAGRIAAQAPSQRLRMNSRASRASASSSSNIRRQIRVAAESSGRAMPKASTTSGPS